MYNHNDILIVGDSFAKDRSLPTDWPMALSNLLTGSTKVPRGNGFGGASWWSTRKCILKEISTSVPKILIVCHTESGRMPNDKDIGLTTGMVLGQKYNPENSQWTKEEFDATAMYYTHLMSEEFHAWAGNQWFNELDELSTIIPIVIHLHCFERFVPGKPGKTIESFTFKHGITSTEILFNLQKTGIGAKPIVWESEPYGFRNHFSPENNIKISDALYRTISNFGPTDNGTKQHLNLLDQHGK